MKDTYIKGVAAGGGSGGAKILKTNQTVSYRTGDDGSLQVGRATDFFTLPLNNPFGNTARFTDTLGGSTYANDIVVDWSTYENSTGDVLMIKKTLLTTANLSTQIAAIQALTVGGFTDWEMTNINELFYLCKKGTLSTTSPNQGMNYAPFNFANVQIWSNTGVAATTALFIRTYNTGLIIVGAEGSSYSGLAVRAGNISELGLTGAIYPIVGAKPLKTGQSTSYVSYDDGSTQRGRNVDFFTLSTNNAFGVNDSRFSDLTGAQVYSLGSVMLDHSTDNGSSILGITYNFFGTWSALVDYANNTLATDGRTDWSLINRSEMERLVYEESDRNLDWAPLNQIATYATSNAYWWTSTTPKNNTARAKAFLNSTGTVGNEMQTRGKTLGGIRSLAVRYYTYAELGL